MKPFSAANYEKSSDRCKNGEAPCALCGKPCIFGTDTHAVQVVDGGARFATQDEVEGRVAVDEAGDMGCHPVGSACAKKLRKAGVHVFEWKR